MDKKERNEILIPIRNDYNVNYLQNIYNINDDENGNIEGTWYNKNDIENNNYKNNEEIEKKKTNINNAEDGIINNKLKLAELTIRYPCEMKPTFFERKIFVQEKRRLEGSIKIILENKNLSDDICEKMKLCKLKNELKILILNRYISVMEKMNANRQRKNSNNGVIPYEYHINAFE